MEQSKQAATLYEWGRAKTLLLDINVYGTVGNIVTATFGGLDSCVELQRAAFTEGYQPQHISLTPTAVNQLMEEWQARTCPNAEGEKSRLALLEKIAAISYELATRVDPDDANDDLKRLISFHNELAALELEIATGRTTQEEEERLHVEDLPF